MSFKAYGKFVGVEPIVPDSGIIKLVDGVEDNRSTFRVTSVGHEVVGIEEGQIVFAIRTAKFDDKGTGVSVRLCHSIDIVAVAPDGEKIEAIPPIQIVDGVVMGNPNLN
jgi:hypothetical protein